MKMMLALLASVMAPALAAQVNPLSKAIELIGNLQAQVTSDEANAKKNYDDEMEECKDRLAELAFEIKTGKTQRDNYKAVAEKSASDAESAQTKIEETGACVAKAEAELSKAQAIRDDEAKVFAAKEAETDEIVDTLSRAIGILEREFRKGGAAMVQIQNASSLTQAFAALEQASELSSADATKLTALLQSAHQSEDSDGELGAPAADAYQTHSGSIVDTLEELLEKQKDSYSSALAEESNAKHTFQLLKQSLDDEAKYCSGDMADAKQDLSESVGAQKEAEGSLTRTKAELANDEEALATRTQDCAQATANFDTNAKNRADELTALAAAKKVLMEKAGGAADVSYAAASLLQRAGVSANAERLGHDVLMVLRDLARKHRAPALAQLESRVASALHSGSTEGDVFKKVKGLIRGMIDKLQKEGNADATEKAYCDEQQADSSAKKTELSSKLEKLTTKINQMSARSKTLKGEQNTLLKELSALAKDQGNMDRLRKEQNAAYTQETADLNAGIDGVREALKVLREFYGSTDSTSAGGAIIATLEVVMSDFDKDRTTAKEIEDEAKSTYAANTKQNSIDKATKEADLKYKQKESAGLDKTVSELSQDQSGVQSELAAVEEFITNLNKKCVAKAETYEDRTAARAAEIAGLKNALQILNDQSFVQTSRSLRGVREHLHA